MSGEALRTRNNRVALIEIEHWNCRLAVGAAVETLCQAQGKVLQ